METEFTGADYLGFGENITYSCKSGFFFDEDFDMKNYSVECYNNGSVTDITWKSCIDPKSETLLW